MKKSSLVVIFLVGFCLFTQICGAEVKIVRCPGASRLEKLAAEELVRYIYLRTGELLSAEAGEELPGSSAIVVARKDRPIVMGNKNIAMMAKGLGPQEYILKTVGKKRDRVVWIVGGDDVGVLYGAYHFLQKLGIRFYLHEDVIPDSKIPLALPDVDETGKPLFELRGLNPWGSHVEGNDLWDADQYKAVFTQMTKMRMNSMALHSYPGYLGNGIEPVVWVGLSEDVDENGDVSFSPVVTFWNNQGSPWGYRATKTGDHLFGSSLLFESDWWGSPVLGGQFPAARELQGRNEVFNRTGAMFKDAFTFGRNLGVKVSVGTEGGIVNPHGVQKGLKPGEKLNLREHGPSIVIPFKVQDRLREKGKDPKDPAVLQEIYEGIFTRLDRAHPLDYYMMFTHEFWYWKHFDKQMFDSLIEEWNIALRAWEKVKPGFGLATCGWVLGPDYDLAALDKALPKHVVISQMSEAYNAPVEEAYGRIKGRKTWAIPWIEEDTPIISPALWAGRIRKDAADAYSYGCDGFMALQWRTRIVEPSAAAAADACWDQSGWNPEFGKPNPGVPESTFVEDKPFEGSFTTGYYIADIGDKPIEGTDDDKIYQTSRSRFGGYRLKMPNGKYRVVLKFAETMPSVKAADRRVFDVKVQGEMVLSEFDIFARAGQYTALDIEFEDVEVKDNWLKLEFMFHDLELWSCFMGLEVYGDQYTRKINVGGEDYKDYEGDLHWYTPTESFLWGEKSYEYPPRGMNVDDFYGDWALVMFGPEAGPVAGKIFAKLDGRMPAVSLWEGINGHAAGGLTPDYRYWKDVADEYKYIDKLEAIRSKIKGPGDLDRFDYWLNTLRYTRAAAKTRCDWGRLVTVMRQAKDEKDSEKKKVIAREKILPVYIELIEQMDKACTLQMLTISDLGGLATILNWEGHNNMLNIRESGEELAKMLGEDLPAEAIASTEYKGEPRLIVPVLRTLLDKGESLKLKVIVLDNELPKSAALYWRPLGNGEFNKVDLRHISRAVHSVTLPAVNQTIEYYIKAETKTGKKLVWPASAEKINQTVVVVL